MRPHRVDVAPGALDRIIEKDTTAAAIPKARISRAVATPTLPKPRMPQTPPRGIRLALNS